MPLALRSSITLLAAALLVGSVRSSAAPDRPPIVRVRLEGRWLLDQRGEPTLPGSFTRGHQPSGLTYSKGELWCIGDQRSAYPGHIVRIDPRTARWSDAPVRLRLSADLAAAEDGRRYKAIPNHDFEGLCHHPSRPNRFFAVTEDKIPWVATIQRTSGGEFEIETLTPIRLPAGVEPWRGDTNFRCEGIVASPDGRWLYIAFERARDERPRLLRRALETGELLGDSEWEDVPVPFVRVPPRAEKPNARLNLNGLAFADRGDTSVLLALARDQERVLVIDPARPEDVPAVVDLELRTPDGREILWVSPEAIAVDRKTEMVWIVNDPDSVRGNYRAASTPRAEGRFAEYTPLFFTVPMSRLVPGTR